MSDASDEPTFGVELEESARKALAITKGEAMPPQVFVPIAELLPTGHRERDPAWDDPALIAERAAVLEEYRRRRVPLKIMDEDGRTLRILLDGTGTDVTAELKRAAERARASRAD